MPIPPLDHQGLLPVGTHDCSIDEIEVSFCWNAHRVELAGKLKDFLAQKWNPLGIQASIWIDGSFTRKKEVPADIDLVVDVAHLPIADAAPVFALLMTRDQIRVDYCVDFWVKHPAIPNDLTVFFCYAGLKAAADLGIDSQQIKGILRVNP
jgi:hypothetical protein